MKHCIDSCRINYFARAARAAALALALMVCIAPAFAQSGASNDELRAMVRDELNRLIEQGALTDAIESGIVEFVRRQQAERESPGENLRAVDAARDHILGAADAEVTLIEYSDFECPYCKRFHFTVAQLQQNNRDKLRWVYRHFPLGFHNPGAQQQAEASECVAALSGNDAFWKFTDEIYQRTKSGGQGFALTRLRALAEETGVNGDAFDECLTGGRMTERVMTDYRDGANAGVTGTPAVFFINKHGATRFVAGALPLDELQAIVDELAR